MGVGIAFPEMTMRDFTSAKASGARRGTCFDEESLKTY